VANLFDAEDEGASKRPTDISELPVLENKVTVMAFLWNRNHTTLEARNIYNLLYS
jgi:hypothetical protein